MPSRLPFFFRHFGDYYTSVDTSYLWPFWRKYHRNDVSHVSTSLPSVTSCVAFDTKCNQVAHHITPELASGFHVMNL